MNQWIKTGIDSDIIIVRIGSHPKRAIRWRFFRAHRQLNQSEVFMREVQYALANFALTHQVAKSIREAWSVDQDLRIDNSDGDMIMCAVFADLVAESDEIFSKNVCASDVCGVSVEAAVECDVADYFDHSLLIRFIGADGEPLAQARESDCFLFKINNMDHVEDTFRCIVEAVRAMIEECFDLDACVISSGESTTSSGGREGSHASAMISIGGRL